MPRKVKVQKSVKENALLITHIGIEWMWASRFLWLIPEDSYFSNHYIGD